MGTPDSSVNNIYSNSGEFINLRIQALKLEFYQRATAAISATINTSIIVILMLMSCAFISVGLAFWLSSLLNSHIAGFMLMGGIYFFLVLIYLLTMRVNKGKIIHNIVLSSLSGTIDNYELLLETQQAVNQKLILSEEQLKKNFEEIKTGFKKLTDDLEKFKDLFMNTDHSEGGVIPRKVIASTIDFVLDNFVLRNAGIVKRAIVPLIAKKLVTSAIFNGNKTPGIFKNLKIKFSKWF